MSQIQFGTSSYSFLWRGDLVQALRSMAEAGYHRVELMASFPHPDRVEGLQSSLREARATAEELGTEIVGVNPPGLDLNLVSPDAEVRSLSVRRYVELVESATVLGSSYLVVVPGRRHPLLPAPLDLTTGWLADALDEILRAAREASVMVVLENTPSNFLDTTEELLGFLSGLTDSSGLSICYDVANGFMVEDPTEALKELGGRASVIHLSDTTASRWRHAPIGVGDVDFTSVAQQVAERNDDPFVILETIHESEAELGIQKDLKKLAEFGWPIS